MSALVEAEKGASEAALSALLAFQSWAEKEKVIPLAVEVGVYHREQRYAGSTDWILLRGDQLTVGDLKTSKALYGQEFLQVGAYAGALHSMSEEEIRALGKLEAFTEKRGGRLYRIPASNFGSPADLVDSVTTILDKIVPKPGLVYWASDEAIEAAWNTITEPIKETFDTVEIRGPWTKQDFLAAMGRKYGLRRDGVKINPPCFAKKEAAADVGTEAHKLCELWLLERVPKDGVDQIRERLGVNTEHPAQVFPATVVVRVAKNLDDKPPFEAKTRTPEQARRDFAAFCAGRELARWKP